MQLSPVPILTESNDSLETVTVDVTTSTNSVDSIMDLDMAEDTTTTESAQKQASPVSISTGANNSLETDRVQEVSDTNASMKIGHFIAKFQETTTVSVDPAMNVDIIENVTTNEPHMQPSILTNPDVAELEEIIIISMDSTIGETKEPTSEMVIPEPELELEKPEQITNSEQSGNQLMFQMHLKYRLKR